MNCRIKINLVVTALFFLLLSFSNVQAQVQKPHYNTTISSNCNGFYDYLPQGYSATGTTLYPVIIFVHGSWENGSGSTSDLPKVLKHGPPHLINGGQWPSSFTLNSKTYKFIVFSPQFKVDAGASSVNAIIDYVLQHYKADPNRIYLTGLSSGGGSVEAAAADPTVGKRIAAVVEFAGTSSPSMDRANNIVANKVAFWGFHNKGDGTVPYTKTTTWVGDILSVSASASAKKSIFDATGHNCWTTHYPASWKDNGLNIYQWMLQFAKGTSVKVNTPPVANAGSDKTATLPTNSVTLSGSGSDPDGSISKYGWTKVSGPTAYTFSSTTIASPTVSGLTAGTYVFRLTVTDNGGATDYDDVTVLVKSASAIAIPGKVQAENYTNMSGVKTETTTDAGGGLNVGGINQGNWMDYSVKAASAATYTVTFRLATPHTAAQFQVKNSSGTVLATVKVPNTGGYQTWTNVTAKVTLPTGTQTLRLYSTGTDMWNINYMSFASSTSTSSAALAVTDAANTTMQQSTAATTTVLAAAPNPFSDRFVLQVNNKYTGTMKVQLIDMSGVVRKEFQVTKSATGTLQTYLSAGTLTKGTYVVRVQIGTWAQSTQIVKL